MSVEFLADLERKEKNNLIGKLPVAVNEGNVKQVDALITTDKK